MRISSAHDGGLAVVRLAGRLDGESAEQLSETLDRLLRDGRRSVLLDMSEVSYLSSPGIHVLQRAGQEFSSLRGELRIGVASPPVLSALGHSECQSPTSKPFSGSYEVSARDRDGVLTCRRYGRAEGVVRGGVGAEEAALLQFPESTFGLGIGALGTDRTDCSLRFGELVPAAGAVAYLPTEASQQVVDFELGLSGPPQAVLGSALVCEGSFAQLARFSTQPDAEAVPLAELARVGLDAAQSDTVGIVMLTETAGLVGAWLRRSPANAVPAIGFDVQGARGWLGTTPEPIHDGATSLVVGIASRAPDPRAPASTAGRSAGSGRPFSRRGLQPPAHSSGHRGPSRAGNQAV
jgi:anti-anti-sigma factor